MTKLVCLWIALAVANFAAADTLHLKDKATLSGKILAEKKDSITLDIGYTVLVVPRGQIEKIIHAGAPEPTATKPAAPTNSIQDIPVAPAAKSGDADLAKGIYRNASPNAPTRTVRELVATLGEAVVQVRTPSGLGSGFILNEDGFLMTNFHVIEGESQIWVEVYHQKDGQLERKSYKEVRIVAMNKFADLALLRIEDKGAPKFKSVALASTEPLAVGEHVFAIGSPLGLERTVTEGILSTKTRQMQGTLYLQTTAQINPGNSGGPLFNLAGQVIGITNMKITFGEGLGFAIPVEAVKFFLDHRDAYAYSTANPSNPYRYLDPPGRSQAAPQ
ncbi:MAG: putative serine protease HhoB precursor [Verrucomicrobiota bacterium]